MIGIQNHHLGGATRGTAGLDGARGAIEYIRNAGGSPEVARFDDDHDPIGPQLRADLRKAGYVQQRQDAFTETLHIELTEAGKAAIALSKSPKA